MENVVKSKVGTSSFHRIYMLTFLQKPQHFSIPSSDVPDDTDGPRPTPGRVDEAWASLLHIMDEHDEELIQGWKDELGNLLTFVSGLILRFYQSITHLPTDRSIFRGCHRLRGRILHLAATRPK